jgi:hypothetical protein
MPNEALREIERVGYVDEHIAYSWAASHHIPLDFVLRERSFVRRSEPQ